MAVGATWPRDQLLIATSVGLQYLWAQTGSCIWL